MESQSSKSHAYSHKLEDLHVKQSDPLLSPRDLKRELPITDRSKATVVEGRERIGQILRQEDSSLLLIIGPCSIHNEQGAYEYASRLNRLRKKYLDRMEIVMRVYFEKPRTTVGWKGLINDPHLNDTQDIEAGLKLARKVLLEITSSGMPAATEFLDPIIPRYISDLISWAAIGARTTESQTHREMASGLSMPIGMKNGTDGNIQTAIDAMLAAQRPHSFIGIDQEGVTSIVRTTGTYDTHIVLRGSHLRTNYDPESIRVAEAKLAASNLPKVLMVDCSHANSRKQHINQQLVWRSVAEQRAGGTKSIIGLMVESYLREGRQEFKKDPADVAYDVSLTDECMGWELTESMLNWTYETLGKKA